MNGRLRLQFLVLSLVGAACNLPSAACDQVVLPNCRLLGNDAGEWELMVQPEHVKAPVFPDTIQFDIRQGKISGILTKYPKRIG